MIAAKTGVGIDRLGNIAYEAQIFAGTDDKVGASLMECVEAGKVQIAIMQVLKFGALACLTDRAAGT